MATKALPSVVAGAGGLSRYLEEIRKFPMLEPNEEYMLAKRWQEHEDSEAAHKLVTSHLRLVTRIAMGYRGYGLPIGEVISEGNVGLMQAVKRFDPDKGFRLATYAMWWIRASIQEYILRSWSLVKMGTTAAQKKLFFNLRRMKGQLKALEEGDLRPDQVKQIATKLGVPEDDVISMNRRLGGDASLNAPVRAADAESGEWQDWLVDETPGQEERLAESEELSMRKGYLAKAMATLNDREKRIFEARRLAEEPATLEDLSAEFGVSRERIRQIEVRAFEKVQAAVQKSARKDEGSATTPTPAREVATSDAQRRVRHCSSAGCHPRGRCSGAVCRARVSRSVDADCLTRSPRVSVSKGAGRLADGPLFVWRLGFGPDAPRRAGSCLTDPITIAPVHGRPGTLHDCLRRIDRNGLRPAPCDRSDQCRTRRRRGLRRSR